MKTLQHIYDVIDVTTIFDDRKVYACLDESGAEVARGTEDVLADMGIMIPDRSFPEDPAAA